MKKNKGITLIALIITIIVLLILAGISIAMLMGENGIISKSKKASEETDEQVATEIIKLKMTDIEISSYSENGKSATLQYLADKLAIDNEIQYISLNSRPIEDTKEIIVIEGKSIYIKLKEYPYEFEINSELQLAMNGVILSTNDNIDYIISNPDIFLDKVLSNESTVKALANNEYAKDQIKQNQTWYSALKDCEYAYTQWPQPKLSSDLTTVEEGTIRTVGTTGTGSSPAYCALDGKKSNGEGGYWWPNTNPAYWQIEFPYEIRIKSIDYYNQYSTDPRNLIVTARLYTDSTKTIPIGNAFSASSAWQKISISGITVNEIITNTIYFYKTNGLGGIGELVINADKFIF